MPRGVSYTKRATPNGPVSNDLAHTDDLHPNLLRGPFRWSWEKAKLLSPAFQQGWCPHPAISEVIMHVPCLVFIGLRTHNQSEGGALIAFTLHKFRRLSTHYLGCKLFKHRFRCHKHACFVYLVQVMPPEPRHLVSILGILDGDQDTLLCSDWLKTGTNKGSASTILYGHR